MTESIRYDTTHGSSEFMIERVAELLKSVNLRNGPVPDQIAMEVAYIEAYANGCGNPQKVIKEYQTPWNAARDYSRNNILYGIIKDNAKKQNPDLYHDLTQTIEVISEFACETDRVPDSYLRGERVNFEREDAYSVTSTFWQRFDDLRQNYPDESPIHIYNLLSERLSYMVRQQPCLSKLKNTVIPFLTKSTMMELHDNPDYVGITPTGFIMMIYEDCFPTHESIPKDLIYAEFDLGRPID
jgi:hypothetical protein